MSYTKVRPASHEDWLEERKKGIGSSEAGTIMGVNRFDTPYRLWRRKSGIDGPVGTNEAMELGHHLEPAVASLFAARTGAYIRKDSEGDWLAVDNDRSYLRVSPDRLYYKDGEKHSKRNLRILECKTSSVAVDAEDIPDYWYCQLQYQMGIMGVKGGALAWISSSPKLHFDFIEVEFNRPFFESLIDAIESFWIDNVMAGVAPRDISSDDTLLRHPKATDGQTVEADENVQDRYNTLKNLSACMKELESQKAAIEDEIKILMGPAESLVTPGGLVLAQWKNTKECQRFNAKAFLAADPEEYSKYVETIPGGRRFSIK